MSRRLVAGVAAVLLALIGAFVLVNYVSLADQRALQDLEPVSVIEVVETVPAGTAAEDLGERVAPVQLPSSAVAQDAVTALDQVKGLVTTTDLQPGEQLLTSRFADPQAFADSQAVEVPQDLQQISVLLEPRRVLGGYLEPGDSVGVFMSLGEEEAGLRTRMIVNHALVARVQNGIALPQEQAAPATTEEAADGALDPQAAPPPVEGVMVTLALELEGAEDVVFAAEHGRIWLSSQPADAEDGGDRTVRAEEILP